VHPAPPLRPGLILLALLALIGALAPIAVAAPAGAPPDTAAAVTHPLPALGPLTPPPRAPDPRGPLRDTGYALHAAAYDLTYVASSPARITTRQALFWAGVLGASWVAYNNDQAILDAVRESRDEPLLRWFHELGSFVEPVGHMGNMNRFYFGGLALGWVTGQDKVTRIFAEILESHFISGLGKNLAQSLAGRDRPYTGRGPESWGSEDATSFPSGHTINIFQLATVLSHHADRTWFTVGAYTVAAAVGVQRVESRAHWASDVIVSAAFGTAVARTVVRLHDRYGGPQPAVTATAAGPAVGMRWRF
jgi:membrane-associated phospholipid phosphatase